MAYKLIGNKSTFDLFLAVDETTNRLAYSKDLGATFIQINAGVISVNSKIGTVTLRTSDIENNSGYITINTKATTISYGVVMTGAGINNANGIISVTKTSIGLGNVDNTADSTKIVLRSTISNSLRTSISGDNDNRNVATIPNDYNGVFKSTGLKMNNIISLNTSVYGASSLVLGGRGWSDQSGGDSHEFACATNGLIAHRNGSTTTWGSWKRIIQEGDDVSLLNLSGAIITPTTYASTTAYGIVKIGSGVNVTTGTISVTKTSIGLANVDNTADITKIVLRSNELQANFDLRNANTQPNDYNGLFKSSGLKQNNVISITGEGTYSYVTGLRCYTDSSGGPAHEYAYTQNGNIFHRYGTTTTWNTWKKVIEQGDNISLLNNNSNFLTSAHNTDVTAHPNTFETFNAVSTHNVNINAHPPIQIPVGSNLNTYTTPNNYYFGSGTITNSPITTNPFSLIVVRSGANTVRQILYTEESVQSTYTRWGNNTSGSFVWTTWRTTGSNFFPDWSASISRSFNTSYTAAIDGWLWVIIRTQVNEQWNNVTLIINGLSFDMGATVHYYINTVWGTTMIPIQNSDSYRVNFSPANSSDQLIFFPLR